MSRPTNELPPHISCSRTGEVTRGPLAAQPSPRDITFDEQVAERRDPAWTDLRPLAELETRQRRWAERFDAAVAEAKAPPLAATRAA